MQKLALAIMVVLLASFGARAQDAAVVDYSDSFARDLVFESERYFDRFHDIYSNAIQRGFEVDVHYTRIVQVGDLKVDGVSDTLSLQLRPMRNSTGVQKQIFESLQEDGPIRIDGYQIRTYGASLAQPHAERQAFAHTRMGRVNAATPAATTVVNKSRRLGRIGAALAVGAAAVSMGRSALGAENQNENLETEIEYLNPNAPVAD